jgi:cytochrome b561
MPNQSPPTRYSAVAQGFHWLVATLIVLQFTLGWTAEELPLGARKLARLDWH